MKKNDKTPEDLANEARELINRLCTDGLPPEDEARLMELLRRCIDPETPRDGAEEEKTPPPPPPPPPEGGENFGPLLLEVLGGLRRGQRRLERRLDRLEEKLPEREPSRGGKGLFRGTGVGLAVSPVVFGVLYGALTLLDLSGDSLPAAAAACVTAAGIALAVNADRVSACLRCPPDADDELYD
ncbi:MAG: hypothetical protein ACI4OU_01415 [Candidatus Enterenecus sp.]